MRSENRSPFLTELITWIQRNGAHEEYQKTGQPAARIRRCARVGYSAGTDGAEIDEEPVENKKGREELPAQWADIQNRVD